MADDYITLIVEKLKENKALASLVSVLINHLTILKKMSQQLLDSSLAAITKKDYAEYYRNLFATADANQREALREEYAQMSHDAAEEAYEQNKGLLQLAIGLLPLLV